MRHKVCVVGCGWLGFSLAKSLVKKDYLVKGSTTSLDKIAVLNSNDIEGFLVKFSSEGIIRDFEKCLTDCDTLVLNIPPIL